MEAGYLLYIDSAYFGDANHFKGPSLLVGGIPSSSILLRDSDNQKYVVLPDVWTSVLINYYKHKRHLL